MDTVNADQAEYWGQSASGAKWLTFEDQMDKVLEPVLDLVLDHAKPEAGERVLDIGCGTGASLLKVAPRVGPAGHVLGADISAPFLDRTKTRLEAAGIAHVDLTLADAQIADLGDPDRDVLISRFGMMFFADPTAAFANLARALRPGARMVFAAWGDLAGNPWFRIPFVAAVNRMGKPPKTDRNAPGPMAFHDIDRVTGLMRDAGLVDVTAEAISISLTPAGQAKEVAALCMQVGPAGRVITHFDGTQDDAVAIEAAIADEMRQYETAQGLLVPAEINLFRARVA